MQKSLLPTTAIAVLFAATPAGAAKPKPAKVPATNMPVVAPVVVKDPVQPLPAPEGCPPQLPGGEAAADWKPPPIPPKEGNAASGGEAAADWRPPPIPPKKDIAAAGVPVDGGKAASDWRPPPVPPKVTADGGEAASDWRPPPIPPVAEARIPACPPQATESADWRPPPIPPK